MVASSRSFVVGDRVKVDWGLDTADGVVRAVRPTGSRVHVLVEVDIPGPEGEVLATETVSVPAEAVTVEPAPTSAA